MISPSKNMTLPTESSRWMRGAGKTDSEYSFECVQSTPAAAVIQQSDDFADAYSGMQDSIADMTYEDICSDVYVN